VDDRSIERERAQNLWSSFARKLEPVARCTTLDPQPDFELSEIGGLEAPKEEIQTYAYAATDPELYARWGTYPPSGLLLIGRPGVGKRLLARALASLTRTGFIDVAVPQLVIEVIHRGGKVSELLGGWSEVLAEMPPLTVFFDELEFSQASEIGARRSDLPVGPVMDLLLDLVDRTIAAEKALVVGSTSHPETLRPAFVRPGRFERIVEVNPVFPDDIVAALQIHAQRAEKRAARRLFEAIEWRSVVGQHHGPVTGDWVRILHAVLRRKARSEASGEAPGLATSADFVEEVRRFLKTSDRLAAPLAGNYV
jgi:ATP-dependent 26S proteasome regulatory subunit